MVCLRYIVINTLYKGDNKDNNNSNNANNYISQTQNQLIHAMRMQFVFCVEVNFENYLDKNSGFKGLSDMNE